MRTVCVPKSTITAFASVLTTRAMPYESCETRSPDSNCSITGSGSGWKGLLRRCSGRSGKDVISGRHSSFDEPAEVDHCRVAHAHAVDAGSHGSERAAKA